MSSVAQKPRVAFQGERGAFSEQAALKLFRDQEIELVPQRTFAALYESIERGEADFVLAPVSNTSAGLVQASVELLRRTPLIPVNEVRLRVNQHLIGCPGATFEQIETVQSHPVALAQCKRFFAEHPRLQPVIADDTAGSVAEIIRRGDARHAAIAGTRAAEFYGASILRRSIQDEADNFTEFVLLAEPGSLAVKGTKL